jgi:large subunit ribosomal protein L21
LRYWIDFASIPALRRGCLQNMTKQVYYWLNMATVTKKTPAPVKKAAAPKTTKTNMSEFAVIATGGKQYRVSVGETIMIEKFKEESKKGDAVSFDQVLLTDNGVDTVIGTPFITGAVVTGEVTVVGRAPKVIVIKYKQKSRYMKKNGHRQPYIKVKIAAIA